MAYEEVDIWGNRANYNGVLIPSALFNRIQMYNSTVYPNNTILQRFPENNKMYFVDANYELTKQLPVRLLNSYEVKFINPEDYFFIMLESGVRTFNYSASYPSGSIESRTKESKTGNISISTPGLFYTKLSGYTSNFVQGVIGLNKNSKEFYPNVIIPIMMANVKYSHDTGTTTDGDYGFDILGDIYSLGYPYGGSYYTTFNNPPELFSNNFYANKNMTYTRATVDIAYDRLTKFSYTGMYGNIEPNTEVFDPTTGYCPKTIPVSEIRSIFPNLIIVNSPEMLESLKTMSVEELENMVAISSGQGNSPYKPGGDSSFGGGGGNFGVVNGTPESSDPISPSLPTTGSFEGSVANAGLFVHYAMNANMLEVVGDWLWATDLGLIIAKEFLSILYGSPIESAISLMSYPFNVTALPGVVSNQQELFWGAHGAGFNATAITNPYATIDWGTIQLNEFWGNFLDYAPHTKLELYLPWCTGFVSIDPNDCLPGTLRVVTNIELAKGTCLHNVIGNDGRVIATHAGTCGKQLPITALDTSGKALSLVSTATAGAITLGAGAAGALGAALDTGYTPATFKNLAAPSNVRYGLMKNPIDMSNVISSAGGAMSGMAAATKKPAIAAAAASFRNPIHVQRSGSFSGSSAGLGVQFPYLILSRPTQSVPAQYGHHYGYPSNIYTSLQSLRGYTEIGEIHLTGFVCTEEELMEIDSLLKGGVIF